MNFQSDDPQNPNMNVAPGGNQVYPQPSYAPVQPAQPMAPSNPVYPAPNQQYAPVNPSFSQQVASVPRVDPSKKIPDRKSVASKMIELVYLLLIILESVMALRFVFKLLGANPANPFIQFLYQATLVFTFPFTTLFSTPIQNTISVSRYDLEFTTLVAMGVYALIAYIVVRIIDVFR